MQVGFSKLKRRLHRLVQVFICPNATLLEITCQGSIIIIFFLFYSNAFDIHVHDMYTGQSWSAVAQWLSAGLETEGSRITASPASLRCVLEQEH